MAPVDPVLLIPFILVGALLYTSVGHGGATVYLAILTLAGYAAATVTTTVLVLNIVAAAISFANFGLARHLQWRLLLPFVATSVPFAYLGGLAPLDLRAQEIVLGTALLLAALRFLVFSRAPRLPLNVPTEGRAFLVIAAALGAALGFLAGTTGIGGGIFLSPILVAMGWADLRQAGAVASAFIVLNSVSGLAAQIQRTPLDVDLLTVLVGVVIIGALVGAYLGARRLPPRALQILLGVMLVVASAKALL